MFIRIASVTTDGPSAQIKAHITFRARKGAHAQYNTHQAGVAHVEDEQARGHTFHQ